MPRKIDEIARRRENALGALRDFDAGRGERDLARPAFDQLGADLALQVPDLHRQRRLRHRALVGGAAEMPVPREGREVSQLSQ